jgi:hypothetical protein
MDSRDIFLTICNFINYQDLIRLLRVCKKFYTWLSNSNIWSKFKPICDYNKYYKHSKLLTLSNSKTSYEQFKSNCNLEFQTTLTLAQLDDKNSQYLAFIRDYIEDEFLNALYSFLENPKNQQSFADLIPDSKQYELLIEKINIKEKSVNDLKIILTMMQNYMFMDYFKNSKMASKFFFQHKKKYFLNMFIINFNNCDIIKIINSIRIKPNSDEFLNSIHVHVFTKHLTLFIGNIKIILMTNIIFTNRIVYSDKVTSRSYNIFSPKDIPDKLIKKIATEQNCDYHLLHHFISKFMEGECF